MYLNESKYYNLTLISFGILYSLINIALIYYLGINYFAFFPFVLFALALLFISYEKVIFLVSFLTPLSVNLSQFIPNSPIDISLFTEPFLLIVLFILIFKIFIKKTIPLEIFTHPLSKVVIFYLVIIFITSLTSTMPIVSLKFFLAKLWFIVPIYFFGIYLFKDYKKIKTFIWLFSFGLFITVVYSTINLSQTSLLSQNAAHFVVKPFFKDHTSYGAVVALLAPLLWGFVLSLKGKVQYRIIALIFAISYTIGTILSYSRASWIGLVAAFGIWVVVKLKIKFKYIFAISLLIFIVLFTFWFQILDSLEKNRQDSSSDIASHLSSITNISTDASNVERLNRWHCAIEMFKEKPITGWGPGTYQFQYAPFQLERMRTIISTNQGDVGNAHSEYLGPLAEQGPLGTVAISLIFISIIIIGLRVYKQTPDKEIRMIALSSTLGLITYFIHGTMNNFLDIDKLSIPFWGLTAIIVAIDIYHKNYKIN